MARPLDALLRPSSVALIGASANPEKLSNIALRNLSRGPAKVFPVNPKEREIMGLRCYPSVAEIGSEVDLAVVSLPAAASVQATKDCVRAGVKAVIVTSSGFREIGPEGAALEAELISTVRGTGTRILGPNTMGLVVPNTGLDTLFIPSERARRPGPGSIAMMSQSGAVSVSFMERASAAGVGLSACIGLGNKADISENELIEYFGEDEGTTCLALYLESFADGREFLRTAGRVARSKPMVLLKAGRTRSGSVAANSHTGAIASSSDQLVNAALCQSGIVRAYDEEELLDYAKALASVGHLSGDRICVVASAGGYGVIASDFVESADHGVGMRMAELSDATKAGLRAVVPAFTAVRNPVDLTAAVTDDMYGKVLDILRRDPGIDAVMMSLELQPPNVTDSLVEVAAATKGMKGPPVVVSAFGGDRTESVMKALEARGIPAYPSIWRAVKALKVLSSRGRFLERSE